MTLARIFIPLVVEDFRCGQCCDVGSFAILVHNIFDFILQLPSTSLLFLLLSAVRRYA